MLSLHGSWVKQVPVGKGFGGQPLLVTATTQNLPCTTTQNLDPWVSRERTVTSFELRWCPQALIFQLQDPLCPTAPCPSPYLLGWGDPWWAEGASHWAVVAKVRSGRPQSWAQQGAPRTGSSGAVVAFHHCWRDQGAQGVAPACWGVAGAQELRGVAAVKRARVACCSAVVVAARPCPGWQVAGAQREVAAAAASHLLVSGQVWVAVVVCPSRGLLGLGWAAAGSQLTLRLGCPGMAVALAPGWAGGWGQALALNPGCADWRQWAGACWAPVAVWHQA